MLDHSPNNLSSHDRESRIRIARWWWSHLFLSEPRSFVFRHTGRYSRMCCANDGHRPDSAIRTTKDSH